MRTKEERQRAKEERIRLKIEKKEEKRRLKEEKKGIIKPTEAPVEKEPQVESMKDEPKKETPKKVSAKKEESKEEIKKVKDKEDTLEDKDVEEDKKNMKKNYHVSRREKDGKWQVKFAKGEKAIKLFDTQAEAIAYAKDLAERNDGTHTIHKKDGKIRKKTY